MVHMVLNDGPVTRAEPENQFKLILRLISLCSNNVQHNCPVPSVQLYFQASRNKPVLLVI